MRLLIVLMMFAFISCGKNSSGGSNSSITSLADKTIECSVSSRISESNQSQGVLEIFNSCEKTMNLTSTDDMTISMDPSYTPYYISSGKLIFRDDFGDTLMALDRKDGSSPTSIYGTWGASETQGNITCDSYYQFAISTTSLKVVCYEK